MTERPSNNFVEIRNVNKTFATGTVLNRSFVHAVSDVSFDMVAGQTVGLVGESGSGKSTLGQIVVGLQPADSGRIAVDGLNIVGQKSRALRQHWRNTQMVFQDPYSSLNPRLTVREALTEPLRNFGIATGADAERIVRDALSACGLPVSALDRYPRSFSGGQRQRIGIARALVVRPKMIIADEPVSALDVSIQAQIVNLLQDLKSEFGLTYLFIAHDLALVRNVADRIAVMYRGRLVEMGTTAQVYETPQHPYSRLLMRSIPIPNVGREKARLEEVRRLREADVDAGARSEGCAFAPRCPSAVDKCFRERPQPKTTVTGQMAACHFAPGQTPVEPPALKGVREGVHS